MMTRMLVAMLLTGVALPALSQEGSQKAAVPAWKAKMQAQLKNKRLTMNFTDAPFNDVMEFVRQVSGLNLVVDPGSKLVAPVTLKIKDVPIATALSKLLTPRKASYVLRMEVMIIGRSDRVAKYPHRFPKPKAGDTAGGMAYERWRRRVTLDFSGTPMADVGQFIRETTGTNFVIPKTLADVRVNLRIEQLEVRQAMALVAHMHRCRLVLEKGGLWKFVPIPPKEGGPDAADENEKK